MIKQTFIVTLSFAMFLTSLPAFSNPRARRRTSGTLGNTGPSLKNKSTTDLTNIVNTTNLNETTKTIPEIDTSAIVDLETQIHDAITTAKSKCGGLSKELDGINALIIATTATSGIGAMAAAAALTTGIVKSGVDKKIEESEKQLEILEPKTSNLSQDPNTLVTQLQTILPELNQDIQTLKQKIDKDTKNSKIMGNIRSGTIGASSVLSASSTATSFISSDKSKKVISQINDCNARINNIKNFQSLLMAELENLNIKDNTTLNKISSVSNNCTAIDINNIKTISSSMLVTGITSAVGTLTGTAGTVTSIIANTNKTRDDNSEEGKKKEKDLNLASNILSGITIGTSGATAIVSDHSIKTLQKDLENIKKCEKILLDL